ncbi:MAG TPA: chlorite dismutase family protein [Candidatus Limnocylindrales bacterium]|nr:chlorite dismutase family protein [Candidatus Limnocylindrales bacterium]
MSEAGGTFIHALGLGIAPEWRRRDLAERRADLDAFCEADVEAIGDGVRSLVYSSIGLEPGTDLLLWRTASRVDALETAAARLLRTSLGGWLTVTQSFLGRMGPSQYVVKPSDQESGLTGEGRGRYVVVYPFTKSTDWYLQARETRQGVMNEHMRVGRSYPSVRQALAYSFGLDDQDFVVAYETDDLDAFGDLVRELRGTDSRRSTIRDTPLLLGIARPFDEIAALLGAGS